MISHKAVVTTTANDYCRDNFLFFCVCVSGGGGGGGGGKALRLETLFASSSLFGV